MNNDYKNWNAVATTAPPEYDHTAWNKEINRYKATGNTIHFDKGDEVRVIKLDEDSVRRQSQIMRYRSGLYPVQRVRL